MTTWHVHPHHLAAYAGGTLGGPSADSVEAHLLGCADCRALLAGHAPVSEELWSQIVLAIEEPPTSRFERSLVRLGCPDHTARLLAATPSLRASWLLAVTATLTFAAVAARVVPGDRGFAFYLVLAPLVPLVGIAAAYAGGSGGTGLIGELATAAPTPNERLLLLRAVAVLVVSCVLIAAAAAIGLPQLGWLAAAWLLPALALTSATLALATVVPLRLGAAALGLTWLLTTSFAVRTAAAPLAVFGDPTQIGSLAIVLAGAAVVARRHAHLDLGGIR